jgi:HAD superfamily hydrolase (TIGR01509 family)
LKALLFDVDGTLADTEEIHRQAFNTAFSDAGLDWDWDRALYHRLLEVTGGRERIRYYLDRFLPGFERPADLEGFIAALHRDKTQHYLGMLARGHVPLRPGVERLMQDALASGLRLSIVTTTTPANVTSLLNHSFTADTSGWFDVIAAGDVVPHKKPAPDIYDYALRQTGLTGAECLAFEDSVNGLRSALSAGVDTLITLNRFTADHDFSGAAVVLDQLGEPGNPCHLIAGELDPNGMVDMDYLRRLHAHCRERASVAGG